MNEFAGKRAAVIGLARAGIPAALFLASHGAQVLGYDAKNKEQLGQVALDLEESGVQLMLGDHGFAEMDSCDLMVLSPGVKIHHEPMKSVVERAEARGTLVMGELELASRFCPCPMIAVTGTKGKSTTVKIITELLCASNVRAIAAGNTGTALISVLPSLTPQSWAVVEVSSFQLEKTATFAPRVAVMLSLLEDHQDYHPSREQYWATKWRIFSGQRMGDQAVFNADDERIWSWTQAAVSARAAGRVAPSWQPHWTSGHENPRGVTPPLAAFFHEDYLMLRLKTGEVVKLLPTSEIPLNGAHNLANVAAAVAAAYWAIPDKFNVPLAAEAIRQFQSLPHRLETVSIDNGIIWINDSQSTIPDAAIAALHSFSAPITLIAGGRSKLEGDQVFNQLARAVLSTNARLILIGEAAPRIKSAALRAGVKDSQIFDAKTLKNAVQLARINAATRETVVLSPACASFDQFASYEDRGEAFRHAVLQSRTTQ